MEVEQIIILSDGAPFKVNSAKKANLFYFSASEFHLPLS
jgi:hypothetical protein